MLALHLILYAGFPTVERIIEDHEKLISVMMNWQKISNNKILFLETDDKYDLFFQPQVCLMLPLIGALHCGAARVLTSYYIVHVCYSMS